MTLAPIALHQADIVRPFRREGLAYVYEPQGAEGPLGLVFRVERLRAKSDELWGLLTVSSTLPALVDVLGPQRHNFLASRSTLVKDLLELFGPPAFQAEELREMTQHLSRLVLSASRERAQVEELGTQDLAPHAPDLVEKLIEAEQMSLLFGPGGAGKGWLAIALALCVKYGRPLCGLQVRTAVPIYLDAEADRETFLRRVKAVARGLEIPNATLLRVGLVGAGSLGQNLEQIARVTADHGGDLLIHDSVGKLSVQIGQQGSYEDAAKEFSDACAALGPGLTHLWIDHVSGEGMGKQLAGRPINSIRKIFDARVAWEIRKEQEAESEGLTIGLYHSKFNNTRSFTPIGLRLTFESDPWGRAICVRFSRQDVRDSTELVARLSQGQQLLALLRRGPLWTAEVAEELAIGARHARMLLQREQERGRVLCLGEGPKGAKRWGLRDGGTVTGNRGNGVPPGAEAVGEQFPLYEGGTVQPLRPLEPWSEGEEREHTNGRTNDEDTEWHDEGVPF